MHQKSSKGYTNGVYHHNVNMCKVLRFLEGPSRPRPHIPDAPPLMFPQVPQPRKPSSEPEVAALPAMLLPAKPWRSLKQMRMALRSKMNSLSSMLPSPLLLFIFVYFTRSNICQHGSREALSQGELFLYKTNNLSSAEQF